MHSHLASWEFDFTKRTEPIQGGVGGDLGLDFGSALGFLWRFGGGSVGRMCTLRDAMQYCVIRGMGFDGYECLHTAIQLVRAHYVDEPFVLAALPLTVTISRVHEIYTESCTRCD